MRKRLRTTVRELAKNKQRAKSLTQINKDVQAKILDDYDIMFQGNIWKMVDYDAYVKDEPDKSYEQMIFDFAHYIGPHLRRIAGVKTNTKWN